MRSPLRRTLFERPPMSEINVTPLVDVMLVLLIIFMVTAPMLTQGVQVNLPKVRGQAIVSQVEPMVVSVDGKGVVHLQDHAIAEAELAAKLTAIVKTNPELKVYLRGDAAVPYGRIAQVMALIKNAGVSAIGLVTAEPDAARKGGKK
ncbi:MAG: protein TolR [Alphaproteobacteria bacterium CG_4_10_14_0_2_um_filter_63_37]|nr:MAG: protein TolR [Proteobacteria bacterium CG1_02_64_396]PJA23510.1 MAG: protein TolR [Alphaproteobacteria bacterium CG_4_10_14_0_2_um_filter_63_37]